MCSIITEVNLCVCLSDVIIVHLKLDIEYLFSVTVQHNFHC